MEQERRIEDMIFKNKKIELKSKKGNQTRIFKYEKIACIEAEKMLLKPCKELAKCGVEISKIDLYLPLKN